MPRIVSDLRGNDLYAWVFTVYLLTMTATMPLWGSLSDRFGRRLTAERARDLALLDGPPSLGGPHIVACDAEDFPAPPSEAVAHFRLVAAGLLQARRDDEADHAVFPRGEDRARGL